MHTSNVLEEPGTARCRFQALDTPLARLRTRLKAGDADMEPGEIMAVIEQVQAKRAELIAYCPEEAAANKVLAMLPRAAELYEQEIRGWCAIKSKVSA